jgi:hypothetical protein
MRTLLALASLTVLIGAGFGCGDDTTSVATMDMAVVHDISATPVDMQTLTCAQVLSCEQNCAGSATCAQACAAEANTNAKALLGAFVLCLYGACNPDAGNTNGSCTAPGDTSAGCLACINATGQSAAIGGACHTEFMNCASM